MQHRNLLKMNAERRRLQQLIAGVPRFSEYRTDRQTSKMWLMPTGELVPLTVWHFQWLLDHPDVTRKYRIEIGGDTSTRFSALKAGFVRINYERGSGTLTVEVHTKGWTEEVKERIFMLVVDNGPSLDHFQINVLNDSGCTERSGYAQLFQYDDPKKLDHIPLISETVQGRALREMMAVHEHSCIAHQI
jgi:hypothetical protein